MSQVSVGGAGSRRPALVLLLGVALMLMAHLVACAVHASEDHRPAAAASSAPGMTGMDAAPSGSGDPACSVTGGADGHPGHEALCCDPVHTSSSVRTAAGTLPAFLLLALLAPGRRPEELSAPNAPPGRGDASGAPRLAAGALLQLVCVSRT